MLFHIILSISEKCKIKKEIPKYILKDDSVQKEMKNICGLEVGQ